MKIGRMFTSNSNLQIKHMGINKFNSAPYGNSNCNIYCYVFLQLTAVYTRLLMHRFK